MTALHYASRGGHLGTVRVLLEMGADHSIRDKVCRCYVVISDLMVTCKYVCVAELSLALCQHIQYVLHN